MKKRTVAIMIAIIAVMIMTTPCNVLAASKTTDFSVKSSVHKYAPSSLNEFNGREQVYYTNGIIRDSVAISVPYVQGMKYSITAKIQPTNGKTVTEKWNVVSGTFKGKPTLKLKAELPAFKKCKAVDVKIVATYLGKGDTWRVKGK